jgi:hypothetical protein
VERRSQELVPRNAGKKQQRTEKKPMTKKRLIDTPPGIDSKEIDMSATRLCNMGPQELVPRATMQKR